MSMNPTFSNLKGAMKQLMLGIILGAVLVPVASAQTVPVYLNNGIVTSPVDIDAVTFINNGSFTVDSLFLPFSTANTLNYTNTGTMSAANGFDLQTFIVPQPVGVESPQMAANFFNSGTISAGVNLIISATNLTSPGYFDLGADTNLKLTGQNLDLTRSTLLMQDFFAFSGRSVASLDYGKGTCPVRSGAVWTPSVQLGATFANSSPFTNRSRTLSQIFLSNSTPYVRTNGAGSTNVVIRAIFLQNNNPDLTTKVYLGDRLDDLGGFGGADIEWSGEFVDTRTGTKSTNYFYLSCIMRNTTNVTFLNGIPSNYTFSQSQGTPLYSALPHPSGLSGGNTFGNGQVTDNNYAYVKARALPSSTPTNSLLGVENLPGRIQISARNSLEMDLAQITGANYFLLDCTNNFGGHEGAEISAAYGDFRLGVTNGSLTFSNLWRPELPRWDGAVEAWNTRWVVTDGTTNYDYRVLLVDSTLFPAATTFVQDVLTRSSNTLVVSDKLNIFRDLSLDAAVLTLTTNGVGVGAGSLAGELNLSAPTFSWAAATPRVRWLTNAGAIRMQSQVLQNFGSPGLGSNYLSFVNRGEILDAGATIWAADFQNYGNFFNQYGPFNLNATDATLHGGTVTAINDLVFNTGTLNSSNVVFQAGSLVLNVTNLLTDNGVTNGNIWNLGGSVGLVGNAGNGFMLPAKPPVADLLGTTISSIAPGPNKKIYNVWSGADRGTSVVGYSNNAAVGRLILDAQGSLSQFAFNPRPGATNALYVDCLELRNYATNRDGSDNFYVAISNHPNFVIYYAEALIDGVSYAEELNHKNNNRLRWVSSYAGHFSSTNLVYGGATNTVNTALAQSTSIDSDGDGLDNAADPTPFFLAGQLNFTLTLTNTPPLQAVLRWDTIPDATNSVYFRTNLTTANWQLLTNFISPLPYPSAPASVTFAAPVTLTGERYYRVQVDLQQP